jgi:peptidoglycan/LPS O-acetylase OafA/YrhL
MQVRTIYAGAIISVSGLATVALISQTVSNWVSQYPILTNAVLVAACVSVVGCAYFLLRVVREPLNKNYGLVSS